MCATQVVFYKLRQSFEVFIPCDNLVNLSIFFIHSRPIQSIIQSNWMGAVQNI